MDYLAGMNNNQGFSLAIERLCGIEIPERARYLRIIFAELNRIASHLVSLGTYGLDMGAFTPFLYAFRERERILDLCEAACGARLTYSYITIGGVTDDVRAVVFLLYKELVATSYDADLAAASGVPVKLVQYALPLLVGVTTVAALTSVGIVLVLALLVRVY